ncbi:hypothetical protein A2U01_0096638, partial [Trifolium medium]|nr:hypothetical protein [Trifolium medium]
VPQVADCNSIPKSRKPLEQFERR